MNNDVLGCPVCGSVLTARLATGRRSGKAFVMLICPIDGRHFRGFITHRPYVKQVLDKLESITNQKEGSSG
jgi:hypothetical protein